VIVTDNLFGDILSDCAAMATGSLGMLPSASLGPQKNGGRAALYEPVHGSAPDLVERAVSNALASGARIADVALGCKHISTKEMGDLVMTELDRLLISG
jgi:3-isopropylmalate dehydrogenase